jgi:hypothetical protein
MLLHFLGITGLLGPLVHGQGAIPFDHQLLKLLGERLTLETFLFKHGL